MKRRWRDRPTITRELDALALYAMIDAAVLAECDAAWALRIEINAAAHRAHGLHAEIVERRHDLYEAAGWPLGGLLEFDPVEFRRALNQVFRR